MTQRTYSSCSYCGCAVDEQHVRIEMWFGEALVVFEHVPAGVCSNCGEEYFAAEIQDKMLTMSKSPAKKTMEVPVYSFSDALTIARTAARTKKLDKTERDKAQEEHMVTDEEIEALLGSNPEDWDEM